MLLITLVEEAKVGLQEHSNISEFSGQYSKQALPTELLNWKFKNQVLQSDLSLVTSTPVMQAVVRHFTCNFLSLFYRLYYIGLLTNSIEQVYRLHVAIYSLLYNKDLTYVCNTMSLDFFRCVSSCYDLEVRYFITSDWCYYYANK